METGFNPVILFAVEYQRGLLCFDPHFLICISFGFFTHFDFVLMLIWTHSCKDFPDESVKP